MHIFIKDDKGRLTVKKVREETVQTKDISSLQAEIKVMPPEEKVVIEDSKQPVEETVNTKSSKKKK